MIDRVHKDTKRVHQSFLKIFQKTINDYYHRYTNLEAFFKEIPLNWNLKTLNSQSYLRKMIYGFQLLHNLPIIERTHGPRIAIINAVGAINTGESEQGSIGSDTMIDYLQYVKHDPRIKAVILRIDSPGGSALASDLVWREIRALSQIKPVVASMVDVAASGGYYFAMGCDQIVAEELSVTGSIGVVMMKYQMKELFKKLGIERESVSIGKFAEVSQIKFKTG